MKVELILSQLDELRALIKFVDRFAILDSVKPTLIEALMVLFSCFLYDDYLIN